MWFADVELPASAAVLTGALVGLLAVVAVRVGGRRGAAWWPVPLLAGSATAVALLCAQAFVVDGVEDAGGPGPLDRSVLAWAVAHRGPMTTAVAETLSTLGGTAVMAVLALLGAGLLWRAQQRVPAGTVLAAAAGAGLLVEGAKHLYQRARPPALDRLTPESGFSLPSGHALGSMAVLGALAAVAVLLVRERRRQIGLVLVATIGVAAIGASRIYLGVHWASDVLAGWLLGGAWLAACVTALLMLRARSEPTRRVPEGADLPPADR